MSAQYQAFHQRFMYIMHVVPGGALLFALIPLVVCGYLGWYHYGAKRLDQALYALQFDQINVTDQPSWILSSVAEEVFSSNRLDRVNLLDPSASAMIASAFETHPWIEKTARVHKAQGRGVTVDVIYRKPLAMIQVHYYPLTESGNRAEERKEGYYPIDRQGVVLPVSDFKKNQSLLWDFLMIEIENIELPAAQPGMPLNDLRVMEALKLAEFLEKNCQPKSLGLQWIRVRRDPTLSSDSPWILELWTIDERMITWGRAPGAEATGETPAEGKLAALTNWLAAQRADTNKGSSSLNLLKSLAKPVSQTR
jgi:hypothetical protein